AVRRVARNGRQHWCPRRVQGQKEAGGSFAGPAHEPGGGGGDPQAHLQFWSRPRAASPFRTRCPRWMFPPLVRCPLFPIGKLGSQQSTRKSVGRYGVVRRYTVGVWEIWRT